VLREVAEYPNSFGPLGPADERIDSGRYMLCLGAGSTWNTVQRQRFPLEELDDVLAEVRAALRERGRSRTQWEVGSSAPPGLVEALLECGLKPDKEPYAVALVLTRGPPQPAGGALLAADRDLRRVRRRQRRPVEAFETPPEQIAEARELLPRRFRETVNVMHGVWLDGELVCAGTAAPTEHGLLLYGGATVPSARGRGAYRALNRARWEEGSPGDACADHPGRLHVAPDPRAPRLRPRRRGAYARGRAHLLSVLNCG
jgi:hypothetical protein